MVTIVVSEVAVQEDGETAAPAEEFNLPRALICSHSQYFESAFRRQWEESKSRRLTIDDLSPQIFRIFVAWLFYQEIFYDGERVEPEKAIGEEDHPSSDEVQDSDDLPLRSENDSGEPSGVVDQAQNEVSGNGHFRRPCKLEPTAVTSPQTSCPGISRQLSEIFANPPGEPPFVRGHCGQPRSSDLGLDRSL